MMGLETYLLVSPFALLAVAGFATWLLVGRKNAPLGSKANKIASSMPSGYQSFIDAGVKTSFGTPLNPAKGFSIKEQTYEVPTVRH